uniref:Uncharacterized protein n=1 Tax=Glycine max TaxID=3847 RepID=A0A0R0J4D4_SOYBN
MIYHFTLFFFFLSHCLTHLERGKIETLNLSQVSHFLVVMEAPSPRTSRTFSSELVSISGELVFSIAK